MSRRGIFPVLLVLGLLGGCVADGEAEDEALGEIAQPIAAYCQIKVNGKGTKDLENDYLPRVVHCENGGAPYEALKAQAIAARTYAYYKIETPGAINDGQSDQVYSCGSGPTAAQIQAVKETAGQVLRYKNTTIAAFYVTYNQGLSGSGIKQTTLGWVNPGNYRNRGCMSQWGSRCLASSNKSAGLLGLLWPRR